MGAERTRFVELQSIETCNVSELELRELFLLLPQQVSVG